MRSKILALLAATLLLGCAAVFAQGDGAGARMLPLPADPKLGRLTYLGGFDLDFDLEDFGGLSGLAVDGQGKNLFAVSDKGKWFAMQVAWRDGKPFDIRPVASGELPVLGKGRDAEELIATEDGWLVSFEGNHRVLRYDRDFKNPRRLNLPDEVASLPGNSGLEAGIYLADGRIVLLAEGRGADELRPVWIESDGIWQRASYRPKPGFSPTGAAQLPSGDILVIERRFSLFGGFSSRLVRVPISRIQPNSVISGDELLRIAEPLPQDNFEAVSTYRRSNGAEVIYLLSDDNYTFFQSNLLLVFELD